MRLLPEAIKDLAQDKFRPCIDVHKAFRHATLRGDQPPPMLEGGTIPLIRMYVTRLP